MNYISAHISILGLLLHTVLLDSVQTSSNATKRNTHDLIKVPLLAPFPWLPFFQYNPTTRDGSTKLRLLLQGDCYRLTL
jgi:hypothetical protein